MQQNLRFRIILSSQAVQSWWFSCFWSFKRCLAVKSSKKVPIKILVCKITRVGTYENFRDAWTGVAELAICLWHMTLTYQRVRSAPTCVTGSVKSSLCTFMCTNLSCILSAGPLVSTGRLNYKACIHSHFSSYKFLICLFRGLASMWSIRSALQ